MKFKKFAAVALSVALATASMPISGLAAGNDPFKGLLTMKVSPDKAEVMLGGTTELKATLATDANAVESDSNAAYASASNAKINWGSDSGNVTVDANGVVTAVKYEMGGSNSATVTATLSTSESVSGEAVVTIADPVLTVDSALEVSPEKGATIRPELTKVAAGVKADYSYESDNKSVAVSTTGEVTAKDAKNGDKAVVTVTAKYNNATIAEAKVNVTVKDTTPVENTLEWAKIENLFPVRAYVNSEVEGDNFAFIPFVSSYDGGFEVVSSNPDVAVAELLSEEAEDETGAFYVVVEAKSVGEAEVTVSHKDGAVAPITGSVVVKDAAADVPVEIESQKPIVGGIDAETTAAKWTADIAAENPDLTAEELVALEVKLTEMLNNVNENAAMSSEAAVPVFPDNVAEILKKELNLKPGEKAEITLVQQPEGKVGFAYSLDPNTGEWHTYITQMNFDVKPVVVVTDEHGVVDSGHVEGIDFGSEVSFILPVPDSSYAEFASKGYAGIKHEHNAITSPWADFEGSEGGRYVTVKTKSFSIFTVNYDAEGRPSNGSGWVKPAGSGSGSSSGSSTNNNMNNAKGGKSGQWQQNEKGWWFRYTDGTYPSNEWVELEWQNSKNWYFFDAEGYLVTGWKQDGATWYYLHPVADGTQGHMYTGWNQINGQWYYFSTVAGGPLGAMLSNTTTPDGYQVGADGAWIQ